VRLVHLGLITVILGAGFTVPAIAVDATLPGGLMQEAARMGLALSLLAGPAALLLARRLPR
jgi:NhaA family Na+:H+ antiporter